MISAPAVVRHAKQGLSTESTTDLLRIFEEKADLDAQDIIEVAKQGDSFAKLVLTRTGRWLGVALSSLAPLFLPEVIAIAGGVSEAGDLILNPAWYEFKTNSGDFYHQEVTLTKAELGWKATVLGAAAPFL
jgi:glucokinase